MQRLFADTRIRFSCTKGNARSTFRKRGNRRPSVAGDMTPLLRFEEEGGERMSGSIFLSNAINVGRRPVARRVPHGFYH